MLINLSEKEGEPELLSALLKRASQSPQYLRETQEKFDRINEKIESQLC